MIRAIAYVGLALLAMLDGLALFIAVSEQRWSGVPVSLLFAGLLVFFGRVLWLGAKAENSLASSAPLVTGWAGQPVGAFFKEQVARSPEGRVLIAGSLASLLAATASVLWPGVLPFPRPPETLAVMFGMWPVLAFVRYVRICGPNYTSSAVKLIAMVAVMAAPFALAAR